MSPSERLGAEEGLSSATLAALLQFLEPSSHAVDEDSCPADNSTGAICYTSKDSDAVAATLRRLGQNEETARTKFVLKHNAMLPLEITFSQAQLDNHAPAPVESPFENNMAWDVLRRAGVVRLTDVLSSQLCYDCLARINALLIDADNVEANHESHTEKTFGNVLSRENRYDLFLRPEGCIQTALQQLLQNDASLRLLFDQLFPSSDLEFHELSALISDPGSAAQGVHPDTIFTPEPVLYTAFIALQDVTDDMGGTVFLPQTHAIEQVHEEFKNPETKNTFLAGREYRLATLKRGDVVVMDSRVMHFGSSNYSEIRRVMMYFTLRSPFYSEEIRDGSLFDGLAMSTNDYI